MLQDGYILNPDATLPVHMRMFRFLGILIGVAIRTDSPIELPLANYIWDLIIGRGRAAGFGVSSTAAALPLLLKQHSHLAQIDTVAFEQLAQIVRLQDDDIEAMGLEKFHERQRHGHLCPGCCCRAG